jgi:hypothetical protein
VVAQDEMKHLKAEVGTWDAEVKMFNDPNAPPEVSKGTETNFMLGEMWMISHFKGNLMGMEFQGSSQNGFDPVKKKYVGAWVDSMSPYPMHIEGSWDEVTKTMTSIGTGKDPAGKDSKSKMVLVHNKDGSRTFTMYMLMDGQEMKMMEIHYTRAKAADDGRGTHSH